MTSTAFFIPDDQVPGCFRHDEACHILDADGIALKCIQVFCHFDERLVVVHRARRITYGSLQVCTGFFHLVHGPRHVPDIVQCIEDPEDIDPVFVRCSNEFVNNIIGIVTVADQVLPPEEHLDGRVLQFALESPETIPGIVVQEPDTGIKGRAAPGFNRKKTALIEIPCKGQHVLRPEPCCDQRLVRIAEGCISDLHFTGNDSIHGGTSSGWRESIQHLKNSMVKYKKFTNGNEGDDSHA